MMLQLKKIKGILLFGAVMLIPGFQITFDLRGLWPRDHSNPPAGSASSHVLPQALQRRTQ